MDFPALVSVEVKNETEYSYIKNLIEYAKITQPELADLLNKFIARPLDEKKQARVKIARETIMSGTRSDCKKRFDQEVAMHPNNHITLEEMIDGQWTAMMKTRRQVRSRG